jgi:hypothetical protein
MPQPPIFDREKNRSLKPQKDFIFSAHQKQPVITKPAGRQSAGKLAGHRVGCQLQNSSRKSGVKSCSVSHSSQSVASDVKTHSLILPHAGAGKSFSGPLATGSAEIPVAQ